MRGHLNATPHRCCNAQGIVRTAKLPYACESARPFYPSRAGGMDGKGESPFASRNMHRLTAKLLLLVLLAGTCAPFAAAMPVQTAGAHCKRKPLQTARAEEVPSCHYHTSTPSSHPAATENSSGLAFHSNQCCDEHQCCRSTVRSLWADAGRTAQVRVLAQAEAMVATLRPRFPSSDLALHYPARAPPEL